MPNQQNHCAMKTKTSNRKGFTLIEIMIVLFVIGVVAAIALPAFNKYLRNARAATFASDVRHLAHAGMQYTLESGLWLPDSSSGEFPSELDGYISKKKFELGTSLGGVWDFELGRDSDEYFSAVGVHFKKAGENPGDEIFVSIDKSIDDGDLNTGIFQKIETHRYYYFIE